MRTPMRACNFRHVFHVFSAVFGHTDLRKAVSKAKFDAESDFEVRLAVAPPKSIQNDQKLISEPEKKSKQFFFRQKIESCKCSETRVAEVSRRSDVSLRGERTFEARRVSQNPVV